MGRKEYDPISEVYEDAVIEGGIRIFDSVCSPDLTRSETGEERVPSEEAAIRYSRFIESVLEAQLVSYEIEDETQLAE